MINVIKITTNGKISLVDIDDIKFHIPFARRFKHLNKYYYVWDDGSDCISVENAVATKLTESNQLDTIYIVKSHEDVSGNFFEDFCESCTEDDLQLFLRLNENLH